MTGRYLLPSSGRKHQNRFRDTPSPFPTPLGASIFTHLAPRFQLPSGLSDSPGPWGHEVLKAEHSMRVGGVGECTLTHERTTFGSRYS